MTIRLALFGAALLIAGPSFAQTAPLPSTPDQAALHPSAIDEDSFDPASFKGFAPIPESPSTEYPSTEYPSALPQPHPESGRQPSPDMTTRNQSLITNYLGTEPLLDNRIDITTQLAFSQGQNNVATNVIVGRTGGAGGPTVGNNIAAATQYSAQVGNANTGFNNATTNLYASGLSPLGNLVRNDVFVGTQVAAQVGNDNRAGNAIFTGSAITD